MAAWQMVATAAAVSILLLLPAAASALPQIANVRISEAAMQSVKLEGEVEPGGLSTTYHFEYGFQDCNISACIKTPTVSAGSGSGFIPVSAKVEGLAVGTSYHFRLVANSTDGVTKGPDSVFKTHGPSPVFRPCANDAFRTTPPQASAALADCRAYEQASPKAKNGLDATGRVVLIKASPMGDRITFSPAGGMPGSEGSQELPVYLSSRSSGSWSTESVLPPASVGEEAGVMGWTSDFAQFFDSARKFSGAGGSTFLSRTSGGGPLRTIVPYGGGLGVQSPSYTGASSDGSLVLFESTSKLAGMPQALEGQPNLYLWNRDTGKLSLAGAFNDQTAPPGGAFAGPYDWARGTTSETLGKGGAASFYYTQDQHAVSADATKTYFTAARVGQIYLRLNPAQEQSPLNGEDECASQVLACTIHVSASQRTVPDPAGTRPAAFVEATSDGSRALFTSSEKLTDDANTGPERPLAAIARSNLDGSGKELSFLPTPAKGIAVNATHIYWANPEAGTIGRAKLDGSNPEPEFITDTGSECGGQIVEGKPQYIAVDAGHVYWTSAPGLQVGCGAIGRANLDGSIPEPEFIPGATNPQGIDTEGEFLYWSNSGNENATRTIGRAKLNGSEVEETFIEVGESAFNTPQAIAVDGGHIFLVSADREKFSYVIRYDLDGSPGSEVFTGSGQGSEPQGIVLDAGNVYWTRRGGDTVGRVNLDLATEKNLEFIKEAGRPLGIAADSTHLYWSANQGSPPNPGNDLYRWDYDPETAAGELTDVAPQPGGNGTEVVGVLGSSSDFSDVYFAANGDLDGTGPAKAGDCEWKVSGGFVNSSGECSLYMAREGSPIAFIAPLKTGGEGFESDAANWLPRGAIAAQVQRTSRVSADGNTLLFRSQNRLTAYDNKGTPQFYLYRAGEGIVCVSCNPTGESPIAPPSLGSITLAALTPVISESHYVLSRNLSADGSRVFFETPDALVGEDTNGQGGCPEIGPAQGKYRICLDAYEWEAAGSGSCPADAQGGSCLYLLSTGKSPDASYIADASASGNDAFIVTRSQLVRQDEDQLYDVYDTSVGGGLLSQNSIPQICTSLDACHQPTSPAPGFESPGTANFIGPPNPKPKQAKKKAHKKKVHKKSKHRKQGRHRTNANGRAGG
ncbi:MAG TPA: hypothetical protein VN758_01260 [Solirubrobacterales bacterium]|nr:hypothetical protein [Solirubrobacterales bacterium]